MEKFRYEYNELSLLENSMIPFGIYQFLNKKITTIVLSAGLIELLGVKDPDDAYDLMDNNMYRDTHPEDIKRVTEAGIRFATEGKDYNVIYRTLINDVYHIIHAQGKHFYTSTGTKLAIVWYMDEGIYEGDKDDRIFEQVLSKEIQKKNREIKGSYDYLTGLPGINYFFDLAEAGRDRYVSEGHDPALLFFDFNGMKRYNLQYGFMEGDNLIKAMSHVLIRHFSSDNCCRFGGDRFAVYTYNEGLEDRLKIIFEDCRGLNGGKSLPVRVGIYLDSMGRVGAGIACDRAKMACDINRKCFTSVFSYFSREMLKETEKQQYIIDNLDKAIKEEWIQVYYQPLIRSANGKVCDEEALARWIDPVKGFMSPADFIPVLEDRRLIYKLDLHVTDQVLRKMRRIKEAGLYLVPCSINISRSDFESCDIVEEIRRRVDASGIDPSLITIEITESIVGSDVGYMKRQVECFRELGFNVWMDDYGSGYSSPDILKTIPFDTIKLDMQFLREFDKNENSKTIINGLIKIAIGLGMEIVAEGVETEEQVEFLKEAGCTKLQGFHFCKPLPLEEVLRRYEEGAQIGFENPDESEYYSDIGKVNLYDISLSANDMDQFRDYFNTMPIAVLKMTDKDISVVRSNKSFRSLIERLFHVTDPHASIDFEFYESNPGPGFAFLKAMKQCAKDGKQLVVDETTKDGKKIHILIRKISDNPVTKESAFSVVILEITDKETSLTYAYAAQALSADYLYLFYVDLETEDFDEYRPNNTGVDMFIERHGHDFFNECHREAKEILHEDDLKVFDEIFTKENILKSIDNKGAFTYVYRQYIDGKLYNLSMKAVRIGREGKHIIIGVNNVNSSES